MIPDVGHEADPDQNLGSKQRIFRAATSVALRHGFGRVTLNLIAREAGFSKGGLLYHFGTKNDLIQSMLEYYANPEARQIREADAFAVAVLIAAAENPALLDPFLARLGSEAIESSGHSMSLQDPLRLIDSLRTKFDQRGAAYEWTAGNTAIVVRHRADA